MKNSIQRKTTSSSTIAKANIHSHAPQVNTRPVCLSQMSSVFNGVPPLLGTTQAFLLRLAQLEAQLVLNLISNIAAGNSYGNPFVPPSLLQSVGIQRSSFLNMYQPPGGFNLSHLLHRKNMNSIPHRASYPSSSFTELNLVTVNKESVDLKEINQKKTPIISNSKVPLPTSEKPVVRSSTNHLGKHFAIKPDVDCSRHQSMTAKAFISPDRPQIEEVEPKQQAAMQRFPTENLIKALASLGLSFEDLELLSHVPDNQLTAEKLPFIIQDIQQRKERSIYHGYRWNSFDQAESNAHGKHHDQRSIGEWQGSALPSPYGQSCPSSHSHRSLSGVSAEIYSTSGDINEHFSTQSRALKRLRDSSGSGSNSFLKRLQRGPADVNRGRPGSVCFPSRSKCSIRHSFVSTGCNKTRHYTTKRSLSSPHRSTTFSSMRNGRQQSFPVKSAKSEGTTESMNTQMPVTKMTEQASAQTKGVIRVSGISLDSESELIKMASPFSHPVEVLMATEVDMETCLEWKKALLMLPTEFSAQEMVKVYSAIPIHMRQQSLELVSQNVDLSSPVSVFRAFVGPSMSNGLLTPLDHLLVVCNVPNQPCAATGVLRLLKPFGKVFRTLVFNGNKVDAEQCLWNKSSIQMVLEMESASVALSVFEWSQKIPCLYHNHNLSFRRGCDIQKDTSVNSAK